MFTLIEIRREDTRHTYDFRQCGPFRSNETETRPEQGHGAKHLTR